MNLEKIKTYLLPVVVLFIALAFQRVGNAFQRQGADIEIKNASTAMQAGKWDDAVNSYIRALKLDSQNTLGLYSLGAAYLARNEAGDLEKSLDEFNAAGLIEPDFNLIHLKKYEVLNQLKRIEEAKPELKRAVQLDPMLIYLSKDFEKARSLASARHFSEALIIYQNLYFDYPTCVPMLIDYANCFAMGGDYNSAFNLYQHVLDLDPANPKALHDLQIIQEVRDRARQPQSPKANILGSELE
jgi:tetratricopeptide (TPR) repeat protein